MREKRVVVLISGRGSNLSALIAAQIPVVAVLSNRIDAMGLSDAKAHGIVTQCVLPRDYPNRESYDGALRDCIDVYQPDVVLLAGFMRILSAEFVAYYQGRLLNIHPSLLPSYPGLDTHARALADGVKIHGCTVHFVTPTLDSGPIVVQAAVPVRVGDTAEILAERVLAAEHVIYPQAVTWLLQGKLSIHDPGGVVVPVGVDTLPQSVWMPDI